MSPILLVNQQNNKQNLTPSAGAAWLAKGEP